MIALIEKLIAKDHAYAAEGHVLFSVPSMPDYGHLSGRNRDEMIAGARVEVAPYKQDPADFVLWKPSTDDQPGWDSPWGPRSPGLAPGCSARASSISAPPSTFTAAASIWSSRIMRTRSPVPLAHPDEGFAGYWVHNGYLMSEGEKMSKSLGNFYTVSDLLEEFPGEAFAVGHPEDPLPPAAGFHKDGVREARQELNRFYRALALVDGPIPDATGFPDDVFAGLCDDINTPAALAGVHAAADAVFAAENGGQCGRNPRRGGCPEIGRTVARNSAARSRGLVSG